MLNANETIAALLPKIERTVTKILGRTHGADIGDVVNDTVCALLAGGLERHEGRASLAAYAMTSAQNNAIDFLKRHRNHGHKSVSATDETADEGETCGITLEGPDGRNVVARQSEQAALTYALDHLLDADEAAFMAALLTGKTATEAGAAQGWSKPTASRRQKELTAYLAHHVGG
jgi:RNA polymerase sigma factor (sigma-70 family)